MNAPLLNLLCWTGFFLAIAIQSSLIQPTECQMIPISEVRTHPPSSPNTNKRKPKNDQSDEIAKIKADVHAKIAAAHLLLNDEEVEDDPSVHDDNAPNIIQKDKPIQFQNPAKHASEGWLLHFLLERYKENTKAPQDETLLEEQVDILQNLEHFAHKFENGRDLFQATTALEEVLLPALNSSHVGIRQGSCLVFAVAAQNNLLVQAKSYKAGVIRSIVHLLMTDLPAVKAKALYAISSLVRNFPIAQTKFIQDGGIPALIKIASLPETRKRSLTFVTDLLNERRECDESLPVNLMMEDDEIEATEDPCDRAGVLVKTLKASGWCKILEDSVLNLAWLGDEEQVDVVETVKASLGVCDEELGKLVQYFHQLLLKFEGDSYLAEYSDGVKEIIAGLHHSAHTEL